MPIVRYFRFWRIQPLFGKHCPSACAGLFMAVGRLADYNRDCASALRTARVHRWSSDFPLRTLAPVSTGKTRLPLLLPLYERYLDDQDAQAFVRDVSQWYAPGSLERLAAHPARKVRRAAVLALGLLGDYAVNATLGRSLLDEDRTVRTLAENAIRAVWCRAGDPDQRQRLGLIVRLNAAGRFDEAIRRATELVRVAPALAEAWYQRAVAHFGKKAYAETIRDCHQALEINPYHFLAATTMGQAYVELGNHVSALESFRRALRLNPDLEGVRVQVVRLARLIEGRG